MNKASWLSILRSILTAVGAYVAGKSFLGSTIDDNLWLGIGGAVVTAASIIWGLVDKTATTEMLQSGLRSIVLTFGTLLVGSGVIKDEVLQSLLAIISIAIPASMSEAAKRTNKNVATGKTAIVDLNGVDPMKVPITPNTTSIPKQDLTPKN